MRHLIESASKLTEATQEQLNQMRQYIQTLTQALEMYPDMAADIEPRLQRLRAFVQSDANQRQQGDPTDPRGDQTNPPAPADPAPAPAPSMPNEVPDRGPQLNVPQAITQFRSLLQSDPTGDAARNLYNQLRAWVQQNPSNPSAGTVNRLIATYQNANPNAGDPRRESTENTGKQLDEASININGADASEVAEILRMMQLAGAAGAKVVGADDINPGPKPCPICGKIHGPKPTPCGGSAPEGPEEPDMGDMIRMMSMDDIATEETDDGGFGDATTEPDEYTKANAGDVSDIIPSGDDLHKEKGSYPATAGGDNPMNTESLKARLQKALAEKRK